MSWQEHPSASLHRCSHQPRLGEDARAVVGGAVAGQPLHGVGVFVWLQVFFCSDPLQSNRVWRSVAISRVVCNMHFDRAEAGSSCVQRRALSLSACLTACCGLQCGLQCGLLQSMHTTSAQQCSSPHSATTRCHLVPSPFSTLVTDTTQKLSHCCPHTQQQHQSFLAGSCHRYASTRSRRLLLAVAAGHIPPVCLPQYQPRGRHKQLTVLRL